MRTQRRYYVWSQLCEDSQVTLLFHPQLAGASGEDSRRQASAPAFLRRALDRTCLSKFQSRWACPRSCSGGLSKVRGRGLGSGSCKGAVAEAGLVDEAYLVRSSWVVA
ncbi:hypothetical protein MTO96_037832 [Rhipicephalus appendiculatus]